MSNARWKGRWELKEGVAMVETLLERYELEFQAGLGHAESQLAGVRDGQAAPAQRNATLKEVEQEQEGLYDLLDQMDIEVNSTLADQERAAFKAKIREYRQALQTKLKEPLNKLVNGRDKDLLFGNAIAIDDDQQRQQLLSNHATLSKTGQRLQDATRIATETEGIGSQIMNDLRSQRETLENARQTLFQADSYVDKSMKTLKTMSRRLVANKFLSYAIIGVLVLLILLVLFAKFK